MKLSQFNLYVPDYPERGEVLVHNTLAGSFAVLAADDLALLRKVDSGLAAVGQATALVERHELADPNVGVVVTSHDREEIEFREWFEMVRSQTQVMEVTVGLNLACNFDCPYCCQAEVMDGSVMKDPVATDAAHWIAERAKSQGVDSLQLVFVGGEPLLHPKRLETVARIVRDALLGSKIRFGFTLLTNAVFLDEAMVDRLLPLGLSKAQITLDGDATTHMLSRVSKQGVDTFELIFDNAIAASQKIEIAINGNYQANTISGFVPLLQQLKAAGLPAGSSVKFGPALGGLSAPERAPGLAATWSDSDAEYQVPLHDEVLRHGFHVSSPNAAGPCEFHERHAFAIGTDGTLYKCPGFLGEPNWGIGHVSSGLTSRYEAMLEATPQANCDGCAHRPNCGGGCIAEAMMKSGEMKGVSCEKPFFERHTRDSVCRSYELATSDSPGEAVEEFPPPSTSLPRPLSASLNVSSGQRSSSLRIL